MEETPKENMTGFRCETEHVEENSNNGKDEQIDYDSEQSHDDNGKNCGNNNKNYVNADENSFRFIEVDCSIELLKSSFKYGHSNILVEDGIQESPRLCQSTLQN